MNECPFCHREKGTPSNCVYCKAFKDRNLLTIILIIMGFVWGYNRIFKKDTKEVEQ
jgi:hypothetical protein